MPNKLQFIREKLSQNREMFFSYIEKNIFNIRDKKTMNTSIKFN